MRGALWVMRFHLPRKGASIDFFLLFLTHQGLFGHSSLQPWPDFPAAIFRGFVKIVACGGLAAEWPLAMEWNIRVIFRNYYL